MLREPSGPSEKAPKMMTLKLQILSEVGILDPDLERFT